MLPKWLDRIQRGALLLTAGLYSTGYGSWGLLLLLVTVVLEGIITRRVPWSRSRLDLLIAAFLATFLVSGYLSPYRPTAVASVGLAALTIHLAFGVSSAVFRRNPRFLLPLGVTWVAGGFAAAVWAIMLHRRSGLPGFTPELGQNAVGTTLLIAFLLGLGLVVEIRSHRRYYVAALCTVLLAGLVVTATRGAWLGAVAGLFTLLALGRRRMAQGAFIVLVLALAGLALFGSEREAFIRRVSTIASLAANQDRVFVFRMSLLIIADHPLIGTGLNTFSLVSPRYQLPGNPNAPSQPFAHNIFLNMAVEGGILGLAAFAGILAQGLRAGWRWHRITRAHSETITAAVFLSALIGAIVHQLFDGTLISVHLGLGMWVLLGILSAGWSEAAEAPTSPGWISA